MYTEKHDLLEAIIIAIYHNQHIAMIINELLLQAPTGINFTNIIRLSKRSKSQKDMYIMFHLYKTQNLQNQYVVLEVKRESKEHICGATNILFFDSCNDYM